MINKDESASLDSLREASFLLGTRLSSDASTRFYLVIATKIMTLDSSIVSASLENLVVKSRWKIVICESYK
jgi:hypothetical protein